VRNDASPVCWASLPALSLPRILKPMEVHFSPEQQGELTEIAAKSGTAPERQWQMLLPVTSMKKPIFLRRWRKELPQPSAESS
jgi:hypothetical protein